jgi:methanogenic corrinoid protein MtbC1
VVMVGGAPLTVDIARRYGADGYAKDAISAVQEAERLFQKVA